MGRAHDNQLPTSEFSGLPDEFADRWTRPLARYLRIEALGGAVLLLAVTVAVFLANSAWVNAYQRVWELPLGLRAGPIGLSHR
jgi:NhaA family Na+:H+ antiporter